MSVREINQQPMTLDLLQALRAIAALLVVIDHSILTLIDKANFSPEYSQTGVFLGNLGVFIFFAISGFIMIHTNRKKFGTGSAAIEFLSRRFIRVVPLYWVVTSVYLLKLSLQNNTPSIGNILKSFLFIPYLNEVQEFRPVYGLGWTLNYEMFFYIIFAVSMLCSFKKGVSLICTLFLFLVLSHFMMSAPVNNIGILFYFWTDPIILYFLIGASISFFYPVYSQQGWLAKYSFSLGLSLISLLITVLFFSAKIMLLQNILLFVVMVVFVSLVIIISVLGRDRNSKSVFSNTICFLGDASYSIYLTHSFLIGPSARVWSLYFSNELWLLFVIAMLIGASILGAIVHIYVEKKIAFLLKDVRWSFKNSMSLK